MADGPAPLLGDAVPVSALSGYGLDSLRLALSALLAELWEDVDVTLPYAEGELLARVRERGTVSRSTIATPTCTSPGASCHRSLASCAPRPTAGTRHPEVMAS